MPYTIVLDALYTRNAAGDKVNVPALQGGSGDTTELQEQIAGKQDKLIAGDGITIDSDGKTISAVGGSSIIQDPTDPDGGVVVSVDGSVIDKSLTLEDCAADAKVVGDKLTELRETKMSYVVTHTATVNGATAILDDQNNVLTFEQLKSIYLADDTFLYVISANIIHIPAYLETHALAFAGTYIIRGEDHIRRVIINDANVVQTNDHMMELADYKAVDMTVDDWESIEWDDPDVIKSYPDLKSVYNLYWPMRDEIAELKGDIVAKADLSLLGGLKFQHITQEDYDLLDTKDADTLYVIVG